MRKKSDDLASALADFERLCGSRVDEQMPSVKEITQAGWIYYNFLGDIERNKADRMICPSCNGKTERIGDGIKYKCTECDKEGTHLFNFRKTRCPWVIIPIIPCFPGEKGCTNCRVYCMTTNPTLTFIENWNKLR